MIVDIVNEEQKQVVLTTHSEHILFRLLTNITEKKLAPGNLVIYYFSKEGLKTSVKELRINEKGQIEGGLPGFFESNIAELDRYIAALQESQ